MTRMVVHCRRAAFDVYIGRPSVWGNPFEIGRDGTREEVIAKYRAWITQQPHLMNKLPELYGMVLGCYCAPLACHGDVLTDLVYRLPGDLWDQNKSISSTPKEV